MGESDVSRVAFDCYLGSARCSGGSAGSSYQREMSPRLTSWRFSSSGQVGENATARRSLGRSFYPLCCRLASPSLAFGDLSGSTPAEPRAAWLGAQGLRRCHGASAMAGGRGASLITSEVEMQGQRWRIKAAEGDPGLGLAAQVEERKVRALCDGSEEKAVGRYLCYRHGEVLLED